MPPDLSIPSPYVGPRPFERRHSKIFFGRSRETNELLSLVIAHRALLIYAPSGAGKTSLVNAGLLPLLEEEGFEVLPPARVQGVLPESLAQAGIANIYVFNTLLNWTPDTAEPAALAAETMAEALARRPHAADELGLPRPRLVIFDQFEELFSSHQDRWQDREGFVEQLAAALDADALLRVIFVMREDYLGQIDPYAGLLPERLQTRFRLNRLGPAAALTAVVQPLKGTGRAFAPGVAEKLVDELLKVRVESGGDTLVVTGEHVEPVQLQVVCQTLWQSLPAGATVISEADLRTFGDVNQALAGFYEQCIERTNRGTGVRRGDLRNWFEHSLITPAGTRSTVYRGPQQTGRLPNAAVDVLENLHLIRGEWRAGARWYELTHDRFIEPIQQSNERWLSARREAEAARLRLEAQAAEWASMGRGRGGLLDEVELRDAERWLEVLDAAQIEINLDAPALVAASRLAWEETRAAEESARRRELEQARALAEEQRRRAEEQSKAARRLRVLAGALGIVLLLAVLAAIFAGAQQREAETNKNLAEQRAQQAVAAQATAEAEAQARATEVAMRAAAEAEAMRNQQLADSRAAEALQAQATAQAERDRFERQARFSTAGDLAAAAGANLDKDPELSLLLAMQAVRVTRAADDIVRPEALEALHQALQASRVRVTLLGHRTNLWDAVFSPDGRRLATAASEPGLIIWNADTGAKLLTIRGYAAASAAAFSLDGSQLISGDFDGTVIVWDAVKGQELNRLEGHTDTIFDIALTNDGRTIASAGRDGLVKLWDAATGRELASLEAHQDGAQSVDFSPDDATLVSAGRDGQVRLWRLTDSGNGVGRTLTAEQILALASHTDWTLDAAFSPDGQWLAAGGRDGIARLWRLDRHGADTAIGATEAATITGHTNSVLSVDFSPDSQYLATSSYDGSTLIWSTSAASDEPVELTADQAVQRIGGHQDAVWQTRFSPDGARLVTAGWDGLVTIWDWKTGEVVAAPQGHAAEVYNVAFSPDGTGIATAGQDSFVNLWTLVGDTVGQGDASVAFPNLTLVGHGRWVRDVIYTPDGTQLISASDDTTARVWDAASGEELQTLRGHEDTIYAVAVSSDGQRAATASGDGTAKIWDLASGEDVYTLSGHEGVLRDVAFSPDDALLATASDDNTVRLWNAATGELVRMLNGHTNTVQTVAFSPSGQLLASGGMDKSIRLWDVATGESLATLDGHGDTVFGLAFYGSILASVSGDSTARLWRLPEDFVTSGGVVQQIMTLRGHQHIIDGLAISPDGNRLATASRDGSVKLWDLTPTVETLAVPVSRKPMRSTSLSLDGRLLATASADGTATVWKVETGEPVMTAHHRLGQLVNDANLSRDGARLATAGDDGRIVIWSVPSGRPELVLTGHDGAVWGVQFNPDGNLLGSVGADKTARLWDATTGEEMHTLTAFDEHFLAGGFAVDGRRFATVNLDEADNRWTVRLWDVASGDELPPVACTFDPEDAFSASTDLRVMAIGARATVRLCDTATGLDIAEVATDIGKINALAVSDDKTLLAVAGAQSAAIWDVATGQKLLDLPIQPIPVLGLSFTADGSRLSEYGPDGATRLWQVVGDAQHAAGEQVLQVMNEPGQARKVTYSSDGRWIATASDFGPVNILNAATGANLLTFQPGNNTVNGVAFSPDGSLLAVADFDGVASIWRLDEQTGSLHAEVAIELAGHDVFIRDVAFAPDGQRVATASDDRTAVIWDATTGAKLQTLTGHQDYVYALAWSPDGSLLATGSRDDTARIWDAATGEELHNFAANGRSVQDVAFSPDGAYLATAHDDNRARLWDAASGELLRVFEGHEAVVRGIAFGPDGAKLATTSGDGSLRLWDVTTGEADVTLFKDAPVLWDVAFSPDGRQATAVGDDGMLRVFDLRPDDLVALAQRRLTRPLTAEECQRYLREETCLPGQQPVSGAILLNVEPGSPAEQAGLRAGDIVVALGGSPVDAFRLLPDATGSRHPGDSVTIQFWRNGAWQQTTATLAQHPDDPARSFLGVRARPVYTP